MFLVPGAGFVWKLTVWWCRLLEPMRSDASAKVRSVREELSKVSHPGSTSPGSHGPVAQHAHGQVRARCVVRGPPPQKRQREDGEEEDAAAAESSDDDDDG